jgi:integrase
MATGGGKTVVMAMLIAWQTLNKVQSPRDARFTNRFLVVTPGLTTRDRLRVLLPEDVENYYDLRDLIPADLKGGLEHARIAITNFHAFQLKDAKEIKGVAKNTRLLLNRSRQAARSLARVRTDELVFTTNRGLPQSRRNALRAIHLAGDAAGLNADGLEAVGLHDLRHSMVAIAFQLGLSAPEVATLARHANARVTLTVYAGLADGGRERAALKLADGGFGA